MGSRAGKTLWEIRQAGHAIRGFLKGATLETYTADDKLKSAVERKFEIIGEAIRRLSDDAPELADRLSNASRIIGFRNILIHGYDVIEDATVWAVATESLPKLVSEVEALLEEIPDPPPLA